MFYVYEYVDPRTNLPFYIGKGKGNRYLKHLNETYENTENKKKYAHITGLRNKGLEPIINKIKTNLSETDAYDLETELIKKYGRRDLDPDGILTNICEDNRPPRLVGKHNPCFGKKKTDEQLVKLREARKKLRGLPYEERYGSEKAALIKQKLSRTGTDNPFYGMKHSDDTKNMMSLKASNRKIHGMTGKRHSVESREKLGLNNPSRRAINTPYGKFNSAEEFERVIGKITSNGLRYLLKNCDKIINNNSVARNKLFTKEDLGKTPRELGFFYEID